GRLLGAEAGTKLGRHVVEPPQVGRGLELLVLRFGNGQGDSIELELRVRTRHQVGELGSSLAFMNHRRQLPCSGSIAVDSQPFSLRNSAKLWPRTTGSSRK